MTGRSTAEIVADLRYKPTIWANDIADMRSEAADRLTELQLELDEWRRIGDEWRWVGAKAPHDDGGPETAA